jgi:hypothetical protein
VVSLICGQQVRGNVFGVWLRMFRRLVEAEERARYLGCGGAVTSGSRVPGQRRRRVRVSLESLEHGQRLRCCMGSVPGTFPSSNGASINNVVVGAAVTRHNDNGQFCKLDMAHGWARPICCCHGFGNDTRSVGHVGRLCPARGDWRKILVCMFSPNLEQRVHGERRGRSRSLIVGHKTPSKSWQGRLRCQGQLVRWRVFVIGRVRRDQGSGHGHGACCRVLGVAAWVLWHCRRFLHDVVGGDDGFRGQKK